MTQPRTLFRRATPAGLVLKNKELTLHASINEQVQILAGDLDVTAKKAYLALHTLITDYGLETKALDKCISELGTDKDDLESKVMLRNQRFHLSFAFLHQLCDLLFKAAATNNTVLKTHIPLTVKSCDTMLKQIVQGSFFLEKENNCMRLKVYQASIEHYARDNAIDLNHKFNMRRQAMVIGTPPLVGGK